MSQQERQNVMGSNPIVVPLQTLASLNGMMKRICAENSRLPLTGLNRRLSPTRPALPVNSFGIGLQPKPINVNKQTQIRQQLALPSLALNVGNSRASFKPSSLVIGQTYNVTVCFVENGPYAFSVQLRSDDREITDMMTRLKNVRLQSLNEVPYVGMPCLARFSDDNHVYRALITGVLQASCRVFYVDYGNYETVTYRDLYIIPTDFLEAKPFAMRFMLSGSKQLEPIDGSLKKAFKNLVLFNHFKLTVMAFEGPPLVQYCKLLRGDVNVMNLLRDIKESNLVYPKAEPLKDNDMVAIRYIDSPRQFYVQKQENMKDYEQLMDVMKKLYTLCMPFEQYLTLKEEEFNSPSVASSSEGVNSAAHHHPRQQTNAKRQYQQQQQQQQVQLPMQQQQQQQQPHLKPLGRVALNVDSNFDSRSNGSSTSGPNSISKYGNNNGNGNRKRNGEMPPRFQNGKQEAPNNTRLSKQPQSARKQQVGQQHHQ